MPDYRRCRKNGSGTVCVKRLGRLALAEGPLIYPGLLAGVAVLQTCVSGS
jgi:hypothetical protein